MTDRLRVLVIVSDIHAGSTLALLPPDFETLEGNSIQQNIIQKWLWEAWKDATEKWLPKVLGKSSHALILNGDLREGVHHGTKQVISPDTADHDAAAIQLLKPLSENAAKTYITLGTESHVSGAEHAIGKALGAERPPRLSPHSKQWAWDTVNLKVAGVRCVFRHHVTTSSRIYLRASALSINLGNEQLEATNNGEEIPRVVGYGHRHTFDFYQRHNALCFTTPAWQALTRFGCKVVGSARPQPGIVVLDWRDKADGELPEMHVKTYKMPAAEPISI